MNVLPLAISLIALCLLTACVGVHGRTMVLRNDCDHAVEVEIRLLPRDERRSKIVQPGETIRTSALSDTSFVVRVAGTEFEASSIVGTEGTTIVTDRTVEFELVLKEAACT